MFVPGFQTTKFEVPKTYLGLWRIPLPAQKLSPLYEKAKGNVGNQIELSEDIFPNFLQCALNSFTEGTLKI